MCVCLMFVCILFDKAIVIQLILHVVLVVVVAHPRDEVLTTIASILMRQHSVHLPNGGLRLTVRMLQHDLMTSVVYTEALDAVRLVAGGARILPA